MASPDTVTAARALRALTLLTETPTLRAQVAAENPLADVSRLINRAGGTLSLFLFCGVPVSCFVTLTFGSYLFLRKDNYDSTYRDGVNFCHAITMGTTPPVRCNSWMTKHRCPVPFSCLVSSSLSFSCFCLHRAPVHSDHEQTAKTPLPAPVISILEMACKRSTQSVVMAAALSLAEQILRSGYELSQDQQLQMATFLLSQCTV